MLYAASTGVLCVYSISLVVTVQRVARLRSKQLVHVVRVQWLRGIIEYK